MNLFDDFDEITFSIWSPLGFHIESGFFVVKGELLKEKKTIFIKTPICIDLLLRYTVENEMREIKCKQQMRTDRWCLLLKQKLNCLQKTQSSYLNIWCLIIIIIYSIKIIKYNYFFFYMDIFI